MYLGIRGSEIIVADEQGVWKARTSQRKPVDERWVGENASIVKWCPWTNKEEKEMDKDFIVAVRMKDEELELRRRSRPKMQCRGISSSPSRICRSTDIPLDAQAAFRS